MVGVRGLEPRASCSQSRRATNCATPRYEVVGLSGRFLPKQARYQLRYTRLWNCFICGLLCGLGRFLTNGFAEMVPASGSVPAGCGVGLFSSWMGPVCSQSRRATNCATPGYSVFCMIPCGEGKSKFFVSVGGAVVKPDFAGVFQPGNLRRKLLSQRFPGSRSQGNG